MVTIVANSKSKENVSVLLSNVNTLNIIEQFNERKKFNRFIQNTKIIQIYNEILKEEKVKNIIHALSHEKIRNFVVCFLFLY